MATITHTRLPQAPEWQLYHVLHTHDQDVLPWADMALRTRDTQGAPVKAVGAAILPR